jgi:hypothetical protein
MGADHEARGAGVRTRYRSRASVRDVRGHGAERSDAMSAIYHEIEAQIRDLRRSIARRPDIDELVARLEERETLLARMRATIAMEARGAA